MEAFAKILKDFQRWTTAEKLHLRSDSISRSAFGTPWKKTKKRRKFSVKLKVCNFIKTRNFSKMFKDFAATFGTLDFTGKRLCRNQWRVKWNSQAACYLIRKIINIFLRASKLLLVLNTALHSAGISKQKCSRYIFFAFRLMFNLLYSNI